MRAIGIDLGTTFSAVATISEVGRPVIVKNADGESTTPSVIYFPPDGPPIVGSEAKEYQAVGEKEIASFFKTNMGDPNFFLSYHGKRYSAIDLSAILLKKLKSDAEASLGEKIESAVITVPAYFNNAEREATLEAARRAGICVSRIINEPTAAAIAYGLYSTGNADGITMVYDLGGGTFDVSLVRVAGHQITVLATNGDHRLGGKNWDDRIAAFLAGEFKSEFGIDPYLDQESFNDLMVRCERAKKELSDRGSTKVSITHGGEKGTYLLTREKFEELTRDLLERTSDLTVEVKKTQPDLTWASLAGVLLVGGSTRMPMVAKFIEETTGKPPIRGINVDEAVALGAAVQAAVDCRSENEFTLDTAGAHSANGFELELVPTIQDVTGHSLGMVVESPDRSEYVNSMIIAKNSAVPCTCKKPHQLRVSSKKANELEVYMLQGENHAPLDCAILGKYVFSGIEFVKSGKATIDVSYSYNRNSVVDVTAVQRDNGRTLFLRVEPLPEDLSWLGRSPRENDTLPEVAVVFAFDVSGSMWDEDHGKVRMEEAQKSAMAFLHKIDLTRFSIGVLAFGDRCRVLQSCCKDAPKIASAISRLSQTNLGGTNGIPFADATTMMADFEEIKVIILLTDGAWFRAKEAIAEAAKAHAQEIEIIAIGIGDADFQFLKRLATCDENALFTDLSHLTGSFSKIAQELSGKDRNECPRGGFVDPADAKTRKGFFEKLFG
ncbi:MAG: Hsp70 family protein [Victivallaceae bacterium]|nr:Hsp70 family protein [Victivallaceae bacterium]